MLKKILIILPIVIFLIILLLVVLHWRTNIVGELIEDLLNRNLVSVAEVEYKSLSGDLYSNIIVENLSVKLNNGTTIYTNYLKVRYGLFTTLREKYNFENILFDTLLVRVKVKNDSLQVEENQAESIENFFEKLASTSDYDVILKNIPTLRIGDFEVVHGKFELVDKNLTLDSLNLKLMAHADKESFNLNINRFSGKWVEKDIDLHRLHFQLIGRQDRITLNQFQIITPHSHIYANAEISIEDSLRFIINLEEIELGFSDLRNIITSPRLDTSYLKLTCEIIGTPNRFSAQLSMQGKANQYQIDSFYVDADYIQGAIYLNQGQLVSNQSNIEFTAKILKDFSTANILFDHFDINKFFPDLVSSDLSGRLFLRTAKLDLNHLTGDGELFFFNSRIDTFRFDTLRFALEAFDNNFNIIEPSFLRLGKNSRFIARGNLKRDFNIDLNFSTENNSLLELSSAIGIDTLQGNMDGNLFFTGKLFDPNLEGYLWIPDLIREDLSLDSLILQIKLDNLFTRRQGDANLFISRVEYGPLEMTETLTNIIIDSNKVLIDTLLFANGDNYMSTSGSLEHRLDSLFLALDFFRINYGVYWIENDGQILMSLNSEEFNVGQASLKAPQDGIIEIRGYWDRILNELQTGILVNNIQIEPFNQFLKNDLNISGMVEGDFELINPFNELEIDLAMSGKDLRYKKVPLGEINCAFNYQNDKFYFNQFNLVKNATNIELDGDVAIQFPSQDKQTRFNLLEGSLADLRLIWQNINLADFNPLISTSRTIKGQVSGSLQFAGTISNPSGTFYLHTDSLQYDKYFSDSLTINGGFNKDSILWQDINFDLNGTSIVGNGWQLANMDFTSIDTLFTKRPFELRLQTKDDRIEFIGFMLEQVERIEGPFESEIILNGTMERPAIKEGYFNLKDGSLTLSRVRNPIENLNINADIAGSVMRIKSFSGQSAKEKDFWEKTFAVVRRVFRLFRGETEPEGRITGNGTVNLDNLLHPKIDLNLDMNRLFIDYFVENTDMVLSANNLKFSGRDTLFLTGEIQIDEGNYLVDVAKLQKNIYLTRPVMEEERTLAWNLDLSIPGNFIISSSKLDLVNNFQFEIMGDLISIKEPFATNMDLSGHVEILSGKYGSWGQDFEIESGTLDFTNPKVINPEINIRANKENRGQIFELSIVGNLEKQQLDLQVRDENGQYLDYSTFDKISLLSLGTTSGSINAGDLATVGGDVINTSVETALGRGAESLTGLDKVELQLEGGIVDLQSFKLNNGLKDASIAFGKYLSSNLYLEYKSQFGSGAIPAPKLSWEPGNQIGLAYRINKFWSVDSYYAQTLKGNNLIQIALSWKTTF